MSKLNDIITQYDKSGWGRFGTVVLAIIFGLGVLGYSLDRSDAKLYERVRAKANTNQDSVISHEEWSQVYERLGKIYSVADSSPRRDLSKREMKQYLSL